MHYYNIKRDNYRWMREYEKARMHEAIQVVGACLMIAISFIAMICR